MGQIFGQLVLYLFRAQFLPGSQTTNIVMVVSISGTPIRNRFTGKIPDAKDLFGNVEMAQRGLAANNGANGIAETNGVDELQPGTVLLHGQYTITRFINNGGFGITYLAKDSLDRKVVIKECFPGAFCRRTNTIVSARSRAHQGELKSIIRLFVQEARSLSKLVHPNIVGVHQVFEDNDTAYMAIDFIDGLDMLDIVEEPSIKLDPKDIVSITRKMLDAIGFVHQHGMLHRDISPDNILLNRKREPILIDFGAAREHASNTNRALSALRVVKDGYSPQEFYIAGSAQGPWSDLYALAASLYHVIKGVAPVNGQARLAALAESRPDPYETLSGKIDGYPTNFLEAIDKALRTLPKERLQTAQEWLDMIDGRVEGKVGIDGNPESAISKILAEESKLQAKLDQEKIEAQERAKEEELARQAAEAAELAQKQADLLAEELDEDDEEDEYEIEEEIHAICAEENHIPTPPRSKFKLLMAGSVIAIVAVIGYAGLSLISGNETAETTPAKDISAPVESGALAIEPITAQPQDLAAILPNEAGFAERDATVFDTEIASVAASSGTNSDGPIAADLTESQPAAIDTPGISAALPAETITNADTAPNDASPDGPASEFSNVTNTLNAATATDFDLATVLQAQTDDTITTVQASPAIDLAENQITYAHWDIQMPFSVAIRRLGGANTAMVTRIDENANLAVSGSWIKEGTLIFSINGSPLDNRQSMAVRILNDLKVDEDGYTRVAVRYKADADARFERGLLAVPVIRQVGLANGVILEVQTGENGWHTRVVSVPNETSTMLRSGDILVAERKTGVQLNSPEAMDQALSALVAEGTATADFRVERDGGIAMAELDLQPK